MCLFQFKGAAATAGKVLGCSHPEQWDKPAPPEHDKGLLVISCCNLEEAGQEDAKKPQALAESIGRATRLMKPETLRSSPAFDIPYGRFNRSGKLMQRTLARALSPCEEENMPRTCQAEFPRGMRRQPR